MMEIGEDQHIRCNGEPEIIYPILHSVDFWEDGGLGMITEIDVSYNKTTLSFILEGNRKNYILGVDCYTQQHKFDSTNDIWISMYDW